MVSSTHVVLMLLKETSQASQPVSQQAEEAGEEDARRGRELL
jgi:hypothetical protein